jgi:hypothetical protein
VRQDRRAEIRKVGPLLLGGLVACSAAAAGLSNSLAEPGFEMLLHVMIVVGFATSLLGTISRINVSLVGVVVIAVALAACVQRGMGAPILSLVFPPEAAADEDLTWATLWAWLMVGFCFMQVRRRNILFCIVSGLAVLGLTATVNLNTVMIVYFGVFLFAAIFVWGYEHLLNLGETAVPVGGRAAEGRAWPAIARTQALAGTMLVALVMVVGVVLGGLLYAAGPKLYLSPSGISRYARWVQISLMSYGGMIDTLYVGSGPINLSSAPAIEVRAEKPALWRGQAYDRYIGNGWRRELAATRALVIDEDGWLVMPGAAQMAGELNHQRVRLAGVTSRALFGAPQPVRVRIEPNQPGVPAVRHHLERDAYGCVMSRFVMSPGLEYEVVSKMPPTDPETLRACPAEYSAQMTQRYIEQGTVEAKLELEELTKQLTSEAETPYDKVTALRDYLEQTCVYSERAPAIPGREDAAAYFVKRSRRGACGLFSTALTMMCRMAGVPARLATGFQTGAYDPDREAFVPLERDAHAWTEAYFPGVGWVPFDQAARRSESYSFWATLFGGSEFAPRLSETLQQAWRVLLGVLAFAALFSALLGPGALLRWLRRRVRPRDARERTGEVYERFRRRAARLAGFRAQRWQTPEEMNEALVACGAAAGDRARSNLEHFTQAFYASRYGPKEPSDRHVRRLATLAARALRAMRRKR